MRSFFYNNFFLQIFRFFLANSSVFEENWSFLIFFKNLKGSCRFCIKKYCPRNALFYHERGAKKTFLSSFFDWGPSNSNLLLIYIYIGKVKFDYEPIWTINKKKYFFALNQSLTKISPNFFSQKVYFFQFCKKIHFKSQILLTFNITYITNVCI